MLSFLKRELSTIKLKHYKNTNLYLGEDVTASHRCCYLPSASSLPYLAEVLNEGQLCPLKVTPGRVWKRFWWF